MASTSSTHAAASAAPSAARSSSRFARRLRVVTAPKTSNRMHHTRTLSELILLSPRSSPSRVTPRANRNRFDMDIEVNGLFAHGEGLVDIFGRHGAASPRVDEPPVPAVAEETAPTTRFSDTTDNQMIENEDTEEPEPEDVPMPLAHSNAHDEMEVPQEEIAMATEATETQRSVGEVVDMLFELHSALKSRQYGQRTAASALAASNLVSTVSFPNVDPIPRDEQLEALENTRKMLECAICQEVFTAATEAKCCGQVFCKDCIERWVNERGSCPMCRDSISYSMLVTSRHAQRMANEVKVTCPYCSKIMRKAALADHMTGCDLAPMEPPPPADVALRNLLLATARLNLANLARFLIAPAPPTALVTQCYIRTRGGGNYELYTQDTHTLLCTAVRRRQYDMSVSFAIFTANNLDENSRQDVNNSSSAVQVARLEKNYMGSQYTMYDTTRETPVEMGAVQYAATFGKSPRQMRVALPLVTELPDANSSADGQPSWEIQPWVSSSKDDSMLAQVEHPDLTRAIHLINKPPVWIEPLEAYCLDFGGRVAAASVKNFLLSHPEDMDKTLMLFGRTQDRQVYSMDYAHPFSPVQAFAIALSSMDSHLVTFD